MKKRRINRDKYDELLRKLEVIHDGNKVIAVKKNKRLSQDMIDIYVVLETVMIEQVLSDGGISQEDAEYLKQTLNDRRVMHSMLADGWKSEYTEYYNRALGAYLGHDTGWNRQNSLTMFSNTKPVSSSLTSSHSSLETGKYSAANNELHLGLGSCFFTTDNKEQTTEDSSEFTQEEIHEYLDAEAKAIECLCKGIEIPEDLREFLLKTIDRRDRLRDLMLSGQIKLDTNDEEVDTEKLFDDIFNV